MILAPAPAKNKPVVIPPFARSSSSSSTFATMMLQIFAPVNWAETIASSKPTPRPALYVVQEGDTLAGIALRCVVRHSLLLLAALRRVRTWTNWRISGRSAPG